MCCVDQRLIPFFLLNSIPHGCTLKIGIHVMGSPSTWFTVESRAERDLSAGCVNLLANSPVKKPLDNTV